MATLQDTMKQRQSDINAKVKGVYDSQYNAQAAQLKTAYDKNLSDAQAAQAKIAPAAQTQANQLGVNNFRQVRNANMQALNTGLGTGTAVQQREAFNRMYQNNFAKLRAQEAADLTTAGQKIVDLGTQYRADLNAAQAEAENKKAQALLTEQNSLNDWYDQQAKIRAGYGDFSAYESLYGTAAANQMKEVWIIQNPEAALGAGLINKKKYKKITGHDPGTK